MSTHYDRFFCKDSGQYSGPIAGREDVNDMDVNRRRLPADQAVAPVIPPSSAAPKSGNGVAPADLRRVNERVVLAAMDVTQSWRVAELMRVTGLTRVTVMDVLRGLQDKNWVLAESATSGGRGRPAAVFRRQVADGLVAGLDIGAYDLRAAVTDLTGSVLAQAYAAVTPQLPRADRLGLAVDLVNRCLSDAGRDPAELWLANAATTGTIGEDGVVRRSAAIADWAGFDLAGQLRERLGVPVAVGNDVQLAGFAEQRWGAAQGCAQAMLLWLGRRPSVSLVLDGKPYGGRHGTAGDLSMAGLRPDDRSWSGSGSWLKAPKLSGHHDAEDPFGAVLAAAREGDAAALEAVSRWLEQLAPVVSLATAIVDPELVVLGGPLCSIADTVLPVLAADLERHLQVPPQLSVSRFGADAVADVAARRAAEMVHERLLDNDGRGIAPLRREALRPTGP